MFAHHDITWHLRSYLRFEVTLGPLGEVRRAEPRQEGTTVAWSPAGDKGLSKHQNNSNWDVTVCHAETAMPLHHTKRFAIITKYKNS